MAPLNHHLLIMISNKDKDFEAKVRKRYLELAGLVQHGQMVNRDKEARAREYVRIQERITEQIREDAPLTENSKYGRLILQANEVQFHLIQLILLRSFNPDSRFEQSLTRAPLGSLISYLNVCSDSEGDVKLIHNLKSYKKRRDALAHGMFTPDKLTPKDRDDAIQLGDSIIKYLKTHMKDELELRGDEKMSDFPTKFNKLVKRVSSLEVRMNRNDVRLNKHAQKKARRNK